MQLQELNPLARLWTVSGSRPTKQENSLLQAELNCMINHTGAHWLMGPKVLHFHLTFTEQTQDTPLWRYVHAEDPSGDPFEVGRHLPDQ